MMGFFTSALAGRLWHRALGFLTSRAGIVCLIALALFTWHKLDTRSAVREAVVEYVARTELIAAEAEANKLRADLARAEEANGVLLQRITQFEKDSDNANERIDRYLADNPYPASCGIPADFLDLLRAN